MGLGGVILLVIVIFGAMYFIAPDTFHSIVNAVTGFFKGLGGGTSTTTTTTTLVNSSSFVGKTYYGQPEDNGAFFDCTSDVQCQVRYQNVSGLPAGIRQINIHCELEGDRKGECFYLT